MHLSEDVTLSAWLLTRKKLIEPLVIKHSGRIVKYTGDGFLVEFGTTVDAVNCALTMQKGMAQRFSKKPEDEKLYLRIGINLAEIVDDDEDIYGDGINIAARIEALADPGGLSITSDVYHQIHHRIDQKFEPLGEHELKNIERKVLIYRAVMGGRPPAPVPSSAGYWPPSAKTLIAGLAAIALVAVTWFISGLLSPNEAADSSRQQAATPPSNTGPETRFEKRLDGLPGIAVLPFNNMSNDPDQDYFSDGMTEDLITDLSQVSGLFVIARNSVFTYKGKPFKVQQVGRELGVRYVLEGSVRRAGDRVRINAQLIDTLTGGHLWAQRYDRKLTDVFALQDEVVRKIVAALAITLKPNEKESLSRSAQVHPDAYDLLLRGLEQMRRFSPETAIEARGYFERALALDPTYARAYADLAFTYTIEASLDWSDDRELSLSNGLKFAQQALDLDPSVRQVHFVLSITYRNMKRFDDAIAASRLAVALDPNYADGYAEMAQNLNFSGLPEEGLTKIHHAMQLNPSSPFFYVWIEGQSNYLLGRYADAARLFERVKASNPQFPFVHKMLAATYSELGDPGEAEWAADELLTLNPAFTLSLEREHVPYKDKGVLERYIEGLRKAGIPE